MKGSGRRGVLKILALVSERFPSLGLKENVLNDIDNNNNTFLLFSFSDPNQSILSESARGRWREFLSFSPADRSSAATDVSVSCCPTKKSVIFSALVSKTIH